MPMYRFEIRKADHVGSGNERDLHVHVWHDHGKSRRLLGRYRLPGLEPVFGGKEPELSVEERKALAAWLSAPAQMAKLRSCLRDTLFDLAKVARGIPGFAEVVSDREGETFISVRIPITRRIG